MIFNLQPFKRGTVLVFLPGMEEIIQLERALNGVLSDAKNIPE